MARLESFIPILFIIAAIGVISISGPDDAFNTITTKNVFTIAELSDKDIDSGQTVTLTPDYIWEIRETLTIHPGGSLVIEEDTIVYMYRLNFANTGKIMMFGGPTSVPELHIEKFVWITAPGGTTLADYGDGIQVYNTFTTLPVVDIQEIRMDSQSPMLDVNGYADITVEDSTFTGTDLMSMFLIINIDDETQGGNLLLSNNLFTHDDLTASDNGLCLEISFSHMNPANVAVVGNTFEYCEDAVVFRWLTTDTHVSTVNFFHNRFLNNVRDFWGITIDAGFTLTSIWLQSVEGTTVDGVLIDDTMGNYWDKNTLVADVNRDGVDDVAYEESSADPSNGDWTSDYTDVAPFLSTCLCIHPTVLYELDSTMGGGNVEPFETTANDAITFTPQVSPGYLADLTGNNQKAVVELKWDFEADSIFDRTSTVNFNAPFTHAYTIPGTTYVQARVKDSAGQLSIDLEFFGTITSPRRELHIFGEATAIITGFSILEFHDASVSVPLDGTSSSSPNPTPPTPSDNNIVTYDWTVKLDSVTIDTATGFTYTWEPGGEYGEFEVSLLVEDEEGFTDDTSIIVQVINDPPVAKIGVSGNITPPLTASEVLTTSVGSQVFFHNLSTDLQDDINNLTWEFEDDTQYGSVVNYTFPDPGTFIINLTVRDEGGNLNTTNITITVMAVLDVGGIDTPRVEMFTLGPLFWGALLGVVLMVVSTRVSSRFEFWNAAVIVLGLATFVGTWVIDAIWFDIRWTF